MRGASVFGRIVGDTEIGSCQLPGEKSQDAERVFRIAGVNHWKPPHRRQRKHRALQRVRVNVWHLSRRGAFEQNDRPMGTSSERRGLWKQAPTAVNVVVTDGKTFHLNFEVSAFPGEIQQRGVSFRKVDA